MLGSSTEGHPEDTIQRVQVWAIGFWPRGKAWLL